MIFPESTIINQKIQKKRFYENVNLNSKIKNMFKDAIDTIILTNKLSEDTIHISRTENIEEIFVFSITLKSEKYLEKLKDLLLVIDRAIPYPILYEIKLENENIMYTIAYKKRNKVLENDFVVDAYFSKEVNKNDKKFEKGMKSIFNSLNLEILYEKIIRIFSNNNKMISIEELVENLKKIDVLKKEIEDLEKKVKSEKQADRQFKLQNELGNKKKELEKLR